MKYLSVRGGICGGHPQALELIVECKCGWPVSVGTALMSPDLRDKVWRRKPPTLTIEEGKVLESQGELSLLEDSSWDDLNYEVICSSCSGGAVWQIKPCEKCGGLPRKKKIIRIADLSDPVMKELVETNRIAPRTERIEVLCDCPFPLSSSTKIIVEEIEKGGEL